MENAAQVTDTEDNEEETDTKDEELELDFENPHVQQVMRANSIEIQELVLTSGVVIELNQPWMKVDGTTPAYPLFDKETGKPALDEKGKQLHLKVGAIFLVEETTTTAEDEDEESGERSMVSTRVPAHYEVWTEPGAFMRRRRIFLDQVVYAEEAVPAGWAADQIMTDRLPESLVLGTKEALEAAKKLEEQNGSASG